MTSSMIVALVALIFSVLSFGVILYLLFRGKVDYATRQEYRSLQGHTISELARLAGSQSRLWRYVEAVDDRTGVRGYQVLGQRVPGKDAPSRD